MANESNPRTERDLQLLVESLEADLAQGVLYLPLVEQHELARRLFAIAGNPMPEPTDAARSRRTEGAEAPK